MSAGEEILDVINLDVKYVIENTLKRRVLNGISFSIKTGEVALILGRSGSGKTTLARSITGLVKKVAKAEVSGEVLYRGENLLEKDYLIEYIKYVGQNPYVYFVEYLVKRDLVGYAFKFYGDRAEELVLNKARSLGVEGLLNRFYYFLSGGEARRVAILKAMLTEPKLLILDEPLMWVDDDNSVRLIELLRNLKEKGVAILIFEQRFLPLLEIVDSIYLLRDGRLLKIGKEDIAPPVSKNGDTPHGPNLYSPGKGRSKKRVLQAINVRFGFDDKVIFDSVNLDVNEGELVIIYGRNGSGKSTLLKLLSSQLKPKGGKIVRSGRARVGYLPQKPLAFFTEVSLGEEVENICRQSLGPGNCRNRAESTLRALGIKDLSVSPFSLSWGEQVRAALALLGYTGVYNVVLLDEPFTGLDYYYRYLVASLINDMTHGNVVSVVLAASSRDSLECLNYDRLYVIENGKLSILDENGVRKCDAHYVNDIGKLYGAEIYV